MKLDSIALATIFGFGLCLSQGVTAASTEPDGTYSAGQASLRFDGHGGLQVRQGEKPVVNARYTIAGDEITLIDESGPFACEAAQSRGVYRWTLTNDTLKFAVINDPCEGRAGDLPREWTHKK